MLGLGLSSAADALSSLSAAVGAREWCTGFTNRVEPGALGACGEGEGGSSSRSTRTTMVEGCNSKLQHRSQCRLDKRIKSVVGSERCCIHDEVSMSRLVGLLAGELTAPLPRPPPHIVVTPILPVPMCERN
jgi:hypothetical protein